MRLALGLHKGSEFGGKLKNSTYSRKCHIIQVFSTGLALCCLADIWCHITCKDKLH